MPNMADDTRQPQPQTREDLSREALTVDPTAKSFTATQWQNGKAQPYKPPENANLMAGGTQNTAGGKAPEVTLSNAWKAEGHPITELHKRPCAREALMTGMGAGFALGGGRLVWRGKVWSACNWAVGSFVVGTMVTHQYCLYKREAEKEGMIRAVEIMNRKEMDRKQAKMREERREERRREKDKEMDERLGALKEKEGGGRAWWKVW